MIVPSPDATIGDTFFRCAKAFGDNAFLAVPALGRGDVLARAADDVLAPVVS